MSTLEIMWIVSTIVMGIIILFFMVWFENIIGQVVHLQEEICKHTKPKNAKTSTSQKGNPKKTAERKSKNDMPRKPNSKHTSKRKSN